MKQKSLQALDQINGYLEALLDRLEQYDHETLNKRLEAGKWSVLDNLHHLMRAEQLSEGYVKKKLSFNPALKKAGLGASWRSFLLNTYANLPFKFKAPQAVSAEHFPETSSLQEVRAIWKGQRESLKNFLNGLSDDLFDKEIYKHPLVGKVTLNAMVNFFNVHLKRHEKQINRTLAEIAST